MSKQDFIALADAIRDHGTTIDPHSTVRITDTPFTKDQVARLAEFCRGQNSRFMKERWMEYIAGECGPGGGAIKQPKPRRRVVCEHCGGLEKTHGAGCDAGAQHKA